MLLRHQKWQWVLTAPKSLSYHILLYLKVFFPSVEGIMKHFEFNCRSQTSNIPRLTPIIWRVSTLAHRTAEEATREKCKKHEYSLALSFIAQLDQHSKEADTMAYVLKVIKLAIKEKLYLFLKVTYIKTSQNVLESNLRGTLGPTFRIFVLSDSA